ncbi:MAG TPA: polymer-forming cytoskeletal protein [Acidobacteriota bacterium]|nr:polymer-forming cytoskeletal protein [Acidobacteriota bacterium]
MVWKKNEEQDNGYEESSTPSVSAARQLKERAIIGHSIRIEGDVSGSEDLIVHGTVTGTIRLKGNNVTVGQKGSLKADVLAKIVSVEGSVDGNLEAEEQVVVRKTGSVQGNITAPRVCLEDGCRFTGSIDMEGSKTGLATTANKLAQHGSSERSESSKSEGSRDEKSKSAAVL